MIVTCNLTISLSKRDGYPLELDRQAAGVAIDGIMLMFKNAYTLSGRQIDDWDESQKQEKSGYYWYITVGRHVPVDEIVAEYWEEGPSLNTFFCKMYARRLEAEINSILCELQNIVEHGSSKMILRFETTTEPEISAEELAFIDNYNERLEQQRCDEECV